MSRPQTIAQAIEEFLEYASVRSERTGATYQTALKHLTTFLAEHNISSSDEPMAISADLMYRFPVWLARQTYIPYRGAEPLYLGEKSRQLYLLTTGRFLEQLLHRRLVGFDYTDFLGIKKEFRRATDPAEDPIHAKIPAETSIERIVELVSKPPTLPKKPGPETRRRAELVHLRNIALILTLITSGMRVSEIVSLKVIDLKQEGGQWGAWVIGKRNKKRFAAFGEAAWVAIQAYLTLRDDRAAQKRVAPIFCRHDRRVTLEDRKPMSTRWLQKLVEHLRTEAGLSFQVTPHSFRHAFARRLLDTVKDLTVVQAALGHSALSTTGIYTTPKPDRVAEAVRLAEQERKQPLS